MKLANALLLVGAATATTAAAAGPFMFVEYGFDFAGNDIGQSLAPKIEDCFKVCTTSATFKANCHALSYANGVCYYKSKADPIIAKPGVNSTRVYTDAVAPAPCAVIEQNKDYVGNDIGSKPGAVTECCKICQDFPGCRAYAWNNDNGGTCWLKSKRGVVIEKQNVQAGLAYPAETLSTSLETDIDYVDHDVGYKPSATADGCFDICASFTGCRAFTWTDLNGGTCWLKTKRDQVVAKSGALSGVLTTVNLEQDINYPAVDMATAATTATAEACRTSCAQTSQCLVFTWESSTKKCHLKKALGTATKAVGMVSGIMDLSYPKCATALLEGKDIEGHDLSSKSGIPNPDDCPGFCKAAGPDCRAYTWSDYMGGTCWLKTGGTPTLNTIIRVGAKSCLNRLG